MQKWVITAVFLAVASSGVAIGYYLNPTGVPPVKGYVEGKEIYFIHTEASDPKRESVTNPTHAPFSAPRPTSATNSGNEHAGALRPKTTPNGTAPKKYCAARK